MLYCTTLDCWQLAGCRHQRTCTPQCFYQPSALQDEGITLELSKLSTYREVCEALADALQLDNPAKLRLTQHNNFSGGRSGLILPCNLSICGLCPSDFSNISMPPPTGISTVLLRPRSWAGALPQQALLCRQPQDRSTSAFASLAGIGCRAQASGLHQNPAPPACALPCRHPQADAHEVQLLPAAASGVRWARAQVGPGARRGLPLHTCGAYVL